MAHKTVVTEEGAMDES